MRGPGRDWPPTLGELVGTLPVATTLRTESAIIRIGSIDVYEGAAHMQLILTLPEGTEPPVYDMPDKMWQQLIDSGAMARVAIGDGDESHPVPPPQREHQGHPELRIRLVDDQGTWISSMPRSMGGHDTRTYRGDYEFMGDLRTLGDNPRLMIEPLTWRDMFERPDFDSIPEFKPHWSIPIVLDSLVPAKEIDAR